MYDEPLSRRIARPFALAALALAVLGAPAPARAQAFLRWDLGARGIGMAGAVGAVADRPSAVFYNPAGIVSLPGTQVQLGAAVTGRDASFEAFGAPDTDADARVGASPTLYVTHAIATSWTGGLSVSEPWRAEIAWRDAESFVGRFRATRTRLTGLSFDPVLAWRPLPEWSVAAGLTVIEASFDLQRFEHDPVISAMAGGGPVALARSDLVTDATAIGWSAAAQWRRSPDLAASIQIRSRAKVEFNGNADFTVVASDSVRGLHFPAGESVGDYLDRTYVDQPVLSKFVFPPIVTAAVAWAPVPPILLDADLQWVGWHEMESVAITFADTALSDATPLAYDDAWAFRVGAELRPSERLRVRVGFARAWTPAPFQAVGPLLPDADRSSISLGAGAAWRGIDFDAGYRLTVMEDRAGVAFPLNETAADGIYRSAEHAFAFAATRRF